VINPPFSAPAELSQAKETNRSVELSRTIKVIRGATLFLPRDQFDCLYVLKNGTFKTFVMDEQGRVQITGFQMPGDVLGLEAIGAGVHQNTAMALQDSDLYRLQPAPISAQGGQTTQQISTLLSQQLVRNQQMMLLMGNFNAGERVAAFLVGLSSDFAQRGYSSTQFVMRMSRHDIACYLGMRLETVSRCIAHLRDLQIIDCHGRTVEILDMHLLKGATQTL
jgi:CRP/FNR family transcriptional regulator